MQAQAAEGLSKAIHALEALEDTLGDSDLQVAEALGLLTRAFEVSELRLRHEALAFSESRLSRFLLRLRSDEARLYALLRAFPEDEGVRRLALSSLLLRKGRCIAEMAALSRALSRGLGPRERDAFQQLRGLRTRLATLSLQGPGDMPLADHQQRLRALEAQGDSVEAELARRSAPLRAQRALPSRSEIIERVAEALPRDAALVEFVVYEDDSHSPSSGGPRVQRSSEPRYLVMVLFPDGRIGAHDLGAAALIDEAATELRDALARRDAAFLAPAQRLYRLAFEPLRSLINETRRLFLSPDGHLALIPFAALHDGQQFLVDAFDVTYLTSGRDLLPRARDIAPASSVVVLADPVFRTAQAASPLEGTLSRADLSSQDWLPLPGTREEAEAILRLLPQAQLFLGAKATKERLLQLSTPGVLHVATHGFFLEDAPAPESSRGIGHFGALADVVPAQRTSDPLLRSGLVLAEAGHPKPRGAVLVTALELTGLDLWGTQLVVLSACDTGRGDVKPGQGVHGLRRAFTAAGAETVVMSLWKVNDETTRQLMDAYYRSLLEGRGRATALREAMLMLRHSRPHPYFWAPFIALGRDAPLQGLELERQGHQVSVNTQ